MTQATRPRLSFFFIGLSAAALFLLTLGGIAASRSRGRGEKPARPAKAWKVRKTDEQWRKILTPEQYRILRQAGTETAFSGKYWNHHERGIYQCAACANPLFSSTAKFESGTGWPSFWTPIRKDAVATHTDRSLGMDRTEVLCGRCGSHLGHVFDDGPKPTHLRYCMNSAALNFAKQGK